MLLGIAKVINLVFFPRRYGLRTAACVCRLSLKRKKKTFKIQSLCVRFFWVANGTLHAIYILFATFRLRPALCKSDVSFVDSFRLLGKEILCFFFTMVLLVMYVDLDSSFFIIPREYGMFG